MRGKLLYASLLDPAAGIEQCISLLHSRDISDQMSAIQALATIQDRTVYPILIDLVQHADLAPYAILALANIKDSRALFPLINVFNQTKKPVINQRILQYIDATCDPRAEEFLQQYTQNPDALFVDIATSALTKCKGNTNFVYRYNGSDKKHELALHATGQIPVFNTELKKIENILEEDLHYSYFKPQTYIIAEDNIMRIGGYVNEHVQVAQGQDLRAAGEISFAKTKHGNFKVEYINARSCSYLPAPSCFHWVKTFFETSDVLFDKYSFDRVFPRDGFNDPDFLSIFRFGSHYK